MKQSTKYWKIFCNLAYAAVLLLAVVFLLPRVLVFFMPFVVGFILSLIANPMVRFLENKIKMKRKYGTVLIIIAVIAVIVLLCYGAGAALVAGLKGFFDYLPTMTVNAQSEIASAIDGVQNAIDKVPFLHNVDIREWGVELKNVLGSLVSGGDSPTIMALSGFAKSIPNVLVSVVMGLLATYFFIADRDKLAELITAHLPESFRKKTMQMYSQILTAVGGYFKAQFKIMIVIYVVITVGLVLLKVDYAWLIGFGIAFLDMLPVFGTGTVLVPWAAIKLFSGAYGTAAGMIVLYVVSLLVHQLIQPKLIGESVGMNPFAALFFMYIGYQFAGVLGMIIAVPVGMLLINFYKAGAFDTLVWCIKEIVGDFNKFRKVR